MAASGGSRFANLSETDLEQILDDRDTHIEKFFCIIKHLFTGYENNSKFIVPSTPTISLRFASGNSWCLGGQ